MLLKWLREPLLHFLLIGLVLFIVYGLQNDEPPRSNGNQIVISQARVEVLIKNWERKWQRPPSREELDRLIEQMIREQVLSREALSLGLDRDDPVIRRRLAQKIEFLSSDIADQVEPTVADLEAYLAANPSQFELPGHISFIQIYLNEDNRGPELKEGAQLLLQQLESSPTDSDTSTLGDPFMFGQVHKGLADFEVSRLFGREFTDAIFDLPVGKWLGPVHSGLGFHLVRIDSRTTAQQPELNTVWEKVRSEWMAEQRRNMNKALYNSLRQKYHIILPQSGEKS